MMSELCKHYPDELDVRIGNAQICRNSGAFKARGATQRVYWPTEIPSACEES